MVPFTLSSGFVRLPILLHIEIGDPLRSRSGGDREVLSSVYLVIGESTSDRDATTTLTGEKLISDTRLGSSSDTRVAGLSLPTPSFSPVSCQNDRGATPLMQPPHHRFPAFRWSNSSRRRRMWRRRLLTLRPQGVWNPFVSETAQIETR